MDRKNNLEHTIAVRTRMNKEVFLEGRGICDFIM